MHGYEDGVPERLGLSKRRLARVLLAHVRAETMQGLANQTTTIAPV